MKSRMERDAMIQALLEAALTAPKMEARVGALLAASDFETVAPTLRAIDTAINVVMDNVRNADTTGFKACTARVDDKTATITLDMTQGSMANTGQQLDLGIQGEGFFTVKTAQGAAYTRAGSFTINNLGNFILNIGDGYRLMPPITVPVSATNISILTDGTIVYVPPGALMKKTAGQIKIARFANPRGLNYLGGSLYMEAPDSGPPILLMPGEGGAGQILSGYLEESNVDLIHEQIRLRFLTEWRDVIFQALAGQKSRLPLSPATRP